MEGDLLIAMEPRHARVVRRLTLPARAQITLAGLWCDSPKPLLPDPYGAGRPCFDFVFQQIDESLDEMVSHLSTAREDKVPHSKTVGLT